MLSSSHTERTLSTIDRPQRHPPLIGGATAPISTSFQRNQLLQLLPSGTIKPWEVSSKTIQLIGQHNRTTRLLSNNTIAGDVDRASAVRIAFCARGFADRISTRLRTDFGVVGAYL